MKLVSKFTLALSLVAVSAAPPAFAQSDEKPKKEKKGKEVAPAAPKRNYSKPFIAAYMPSPPRPRFRRLLQRSATTMTGMKQAFLRSTSARR